MRLLTARLRRFALCLALLGMAMSVVAPALSRALAGGEAWVLICSPGRAKLLEREGGPQWPGKALPHAFDPCGYCNLAGTTPALPGAPAHGLPVAESATFVAPADGASLPVQLAQAAHRVRGPPSAS